MVLRWFSPCDDLLLPVFGSELFADCSRSAATVPYVEYLHDITLNGEKDSVDVRLSSVQELADFDRQVQALRGYRAAGWQS